ncbi:hypothetical protein R1sor_012160 [Riccia sorocarpa]|uniref:ABC transporter domain-containing protein n=1 Tax=Riccia sorocarpa TaxID=122646 RepID=A0ABD3I6B9_9MARC
MSRGSTLPQVPAETDSAHIAHSGKLSPLSATLWRKSLKSLKEVGPENVDTSARLTWKDLWVTITTPKGDPQTLLHGLTGYAEPGAIMAIMGPSGSGKSTLLDSLAGRLAKNATLSGDILINGRRKLLSYGTAAYVTQQDDLIGTLTVRESIRYSADLRLPRSIPSKEKTAIVESVIVEMGLQDCANTPIGNWHLRGLSGGEKRRVSIALEILTRPRILFLDEPTSGLDSASAFFVITTLKNLARDGRTIIASIHQPSSEVFDLFDMLCLLSNGKTVYFGEAHVAHEFFSESGFPCPALRNPSDHFLRAINADFDRVKSTVKGSFKLRALDIESPQDPLERMSTTQVVKILVESYQQSEYAMLAAAKVHEISQVKGTVLESAGSLAGFWMQAYTLTRRSFKNMSRDMGYYWLRLMIYIVLTLCIGTIFYDVGHTFTSILGRAGCMSYVAGFLTFMSIGGFPSFVEDMKVFCRERLNGHYGVGAFVIGNTLSSIPFLFLISIVSGSIVYFMVGLHPGAMHFIYFVLVLFVCVTCVESLMMAVASVVPNFLMGIITGAGIQGIFMLTAGFFRLPGDLPKPFWRYPMSYLSFHMYALQGMYENDFLGLEFTNIEIQGVFLGPRLNGKEILERTYQIDLHRSKWVNLGAIVIMVICYRLLFLLMIKFSEEVQPLIRVLMGKYFHYRSAGRISGRPQSELQSTPDSAGSTARPSVSAPSPAHEHAPLQQHQHFWTASPSPQAPVVPPRMIHS